MDLLNKTSNPAFTAYFWNTSTNSKTLSVRGVIIKTFFCLFIVTAIAIATWKLHSNGITIKWFTPVGMLSAIAISILISFKQNWASILVPLYAIAKGFFLGGITTYAKIQFPDLPYQAVGVTIITFFVVLVLYQTRIIVVTKKLRAVIITVCSSIFIVYLISWIFSFFGIKSFIYGNTWIAIAFNIVAATFAALSLLIDFDYIERQKNRAPKAKEWLATWGLLVTLIWLYVEILRLTKRFAIPTKL